MRTGTFSFIDLFAGIGGLRSGFDAIGGKCLSMSEWNTYSSRNLPGRTIMEWERAPASIQTSVTSPFSNRPEVTDDEAYKFIDASIPDHDVSFAGFPCQPFSIAGVSVKELYMGRNTVSSATLRVRSWCGVIIQTNNLQFCSGNVKNLKSHDKGNTFNIISENARWAWLRRRKTAKSTGADDPLKSSMAVISDPSTVNVSSLLVSPRPTSERRFYSETLKDFYPDKRPSLSQIYWILSVDSKIHPSPTKLLGVLIQLCKETCGKGNGFGFGLVDPSNVNSVTRTLSAAIWKTDLKFWLIGLVSMNWGETDFHNTYNMDRRSRITNATWMQQTNGLR